jgi:CheY-like chemotaxis protein
MTKAHFDDLKALVVDDNEHMRELLHALLNVLGIREVVEAADGEAGYAALAQYQPDFILTDLAMQPVDGIEFTRRVRLSPDTPNPFVPIIMVSGHTERNRVEAARDAGVTEMLAKPITTQNLFARIAEIVEHPRAFVRCQSYFGPDRRRRHGEPHNGPWLRFDDHAADVVAI